MSKLIDDLRMAGRMTQVFATLATIAILLLIGTTFPPFWALIAFPLLRLVYLCRTDGTKSNGASKRPAQLTAKERVAKMREEAERRNRIEEAERILRGND